MPTCAVAAVSLLAQLPFYDRFVSFMDEGHMLQYSDLLAKGGELYRDATIYPLPGSFYLLSIAFRLFEPSILLARWIVVLEFSLFSALVFTLLRRLVSPWYAGFGVFLLLIYRVWVFPHWQMYSYSTTALLLILGSLSALISFFQTQSRRSLVLAGTLFGLAVLCKQDYGAAALVSLLFALAVHAGSLPQRNRQQVLVQFALFLVPAALVGLITGIHYLRVGLLSELIHQTVLNHFVGIASFDYSSFPSLLPLFGQDPALRDPVAIFDYWPGILLTTDYFQSTGASFLYRETALLDGAVKAFYYLPYPLILAGAIRLWRRRAALADARRFGFLCELSLFSLAAALVSLFSLNRPQDYVHLAVIYWPLLCLGIVYLHDLLRERRRLAQILAALLLLPIGAATLYTVRLAWTIRSVHSEMIPGTRAGIRARPGEAQALAAVVDYVRAHSLPDDPVAVMPYFPIVHFLAERRAPHASSYIVWPFPDYPDREERIIDSIEETDTQVVIYNFTSFPSYPPAEEYAPDLFAYLVDHFEIDRVFAYGTLSYSLAALRRERLPPQGAPLFTSEAEASLHVETRAGSRIAIRPVDRPRYLAYEAWPFRPVVALRPSTGGARTLLEAPLPIPRGARLRTAVGVHPRAWDTYPASWIDFRIEIESDGARETLFQRTLDPNRKVRDRGWFDVSITLDAYAGRPATIRFSTSCEGAEGEELHMGGWAEPRVVVSHDGR